MFINTNTETNIVIIAESIAFEPAIIAFIPEFIESDSIS